MKRLRLAAALAFLVPAAALAHDIEKGPNGGPVFDASGHHVEFVSQGAQLAFYLSDEGGRPIPSKGASGRAVVQENGKTATVQLTTADPNKLVGNVPQPLAAGARVVVSATMADGHSIQARFVNK